MSSKGYRSVTGNDLAAGRSTSPHSQESRSSMHLTPESESPDEDDAELDDIEADEGYELDRIQQTSNHEFVALRSHRRQSSAQSFELYTPDEERAVRQKLDTRLVLFVALLYLISFLDRSNIGNAKIAGLVDDLHLSDAQYEMLLTSFYVCYILFEWMTLCYKVFPPHIYISCCVFTWGLVASLQSLATGFPAMVVLRACLGIGEAAFVGIPYYLSFFFKREELALRTGLFISAAPLATSFASTLAWLIVRFGDTTGIASWRLLFLFEGFPACLIAVWAWSWIPDSPSSAWWFSDRERRIATLRMRNEMNVLPQSKRAAGVRLDIPRHRLKFQWSEVRRTIVDPASYLTAGMFFCCNVAFSSMPVFLPTILEDMGLSQLESQGLSAPPFLFAFVIVIISALISDRMRSRSIPMMLHCSLAALGYLFLALAGFFRAGFWPRYLCVFLINSGFFSAVTLVITWTINNQNSDEGKGTGMAILNFIGQLGPLLGTRLYPDDEGPYFIKGMSICAFFMALAGILTIGLRVVLKRRNARHGSRREGNNKPLVYLT